MNDQYNFNPYHNQSDPLENIPVTSLMIDHLRATKPWVRLISIVLFIMSGLIIVGGLAMMLMPFQGGFGGGIGAFFGLLYIAFGIIYFFPAYFLMKYASSINQLLQGGGDVAMEDALGNQKSFWKFSGIMTLVVICIYGIMFVVIIGSSVSAFMR